MKDNTVNWYENIIKEQGLTPPLSHSLKLHATCLALLSLFHFYLLIHRRWQTTCIVSLSL